LDVARAPADAGIAANKDDEDDDKSNHRIKTTGVKLSCFFYENRVNQI